MKFRSVASPPVMSRTMAARKLRSTYSKNFYKELDNFSTAFVNEAKRRKINLFSRKYFEVERLIAERKSKEEYCLFFVQFAFSLGGYLHL